MTWAQHHILRQKFSDDQQGLRKALDSILPHLRLLTFSLSELAETFSKKSCPVSVTEGFALFLSVENITREPPPRFSQSRARRLEYTPQEFHVYGCVTPSSLPPLNTLVEDTFSVHTSTTIVLLKYTILGVVLPTQIKLAANPREGYAEEVIVLLYHGLAMVLLSRVQVPSEI